jgi:hypothetical protein
MPPQPIRRREVSDLVAELPEIFFGYEQRKVILGGRPAVCFFEMFAVVKSNITHSLVDIVKSRQIDQKPFHYLLLSVEKISAKLILFGNLQVVCVTYLVFILVYSLLGGIKVMLYVVNYRHSRR